MALKQRSEVQTDFTWNFTDMYPSDEAWEAAYSEAESLIGGVAAIQGTLGKSSEAMKAGLDLLFDAMQKIELLYVYSMFRLNVDNGDPKYQTMNGRAMNLLVKVSTATSFLEPEILAIPADKLAEMISDPLLSGYKHMLLHIQ